MAKTYKNGKTKARRNRKIKTNRRRRYKGGACNKADPEEQKKCLTELQEAFNKIDDFSKKR
jgi:hypothetical protein